MSPDPKAPALGLGQGKGNGREGKKTRRGERRRMNE